MTADASQHDQASSGDNVLVVDDLRTHFHVPAGAVKAVDGVSLTLSKGTTLGVVGESGSGKTVLSRSIMGLNTAENAMTSGSVIYDGVELVGKSPKEMKDLWGAEMAMVFQDPMTSLNPVVKVGRQLTEHMRYHLGISKAEARERAVGLLREVRIPEADERFDNYPHEMSGGMRQRVCIASALACDPKLLFADEPTTALDVTVQHQILNLLGRLQREHHMTMIMVTHDLGVVATRANEIAVMYAGKIVEKAPTQALFADMKHPYTQSLLWSIPKTSQPKHTRLSAIAGRPPDLINPPPGCKFAPRCAYAQPVCIEVEPPLRTQADGHQYACHIPVGTPESKAAFESNLDAGLAQTLTAAGKMSAREDIEPDYSVIVGDGTEEHAKMLRENKNAQDLAWKAQPWEAEH
ncbi:ABC transporter ATP-binding protein [Ilumatobacter sp.]|uniref:ABC transporter ATP-binding protein n=1 Tax=Ilumatobacter sp. TaxID=1967498 RepID=UPI003AF5A318